MASWRRGPTVHNEYPSASKKLDRGTALGKAIKIKVKDWGIKKSSEPDQ